MPKFKDYDSGLGNHNYAFHCPGCDDLHTIRYQGTEPVWQVTGAAENVPTVSPSIMVNGGKRNPEAHTCHSFIKDGQIQFLGDCMHALAGQTVALPEFEQTESRKYIG